MLKVIPFYAFCSGKVKRVFNWNASQGTSGNASMGNCVFIQSANPKPSNGGSYLRTIYMHMQSAPLVSVGQYVTKGQIIGCMGNTGNSSAAHLHFAMQANSTDMNLKRALIGMLIVIGSTRWRTSNREKYALA